MLHLWREIAINTIDLLATTFDRKIVEFLWFDAVQVLKYICPDAAEARPVWVNFTGSSRAIEVDTPTIFTH
jgi:hypothetical protein